MTTIYATNVRFNDDTSDYECKNCNCKLRICTVDVYQWGSKKLPLNIIQGFKAEGCPECGDIRIDRDMPLFFVMEQFNSYVKELFE